MKTLVQHLGEQPLVLLRGMVQAQGLLIDAETASALAAALAGRMLDRDHLAQVLADLPAEAQAALQALAAAANRLPAAAFQRRFGDIRRLGPGRLQQERPWVAPANAAEHLWYRGLIARGFEESPAGLVEFVAIPSDLIALLPRFETGDRALQLAAVTPPGRPRHAGDQFLEDLGTLLIEVQNAKVWLRANGEWRRDDVSRFISRWQQPPPSDQRAPAPGGRAALLFHCAGRLGFLTQQGKRQRLAAEALVPWLALDRFQQRQAVFDAWRHSPEWDDLCLTPGLICEPGNWRHDPLRARAALLAHLGRCAAGQWHRLDDLVASLQAFDPDFQRPDGKYDTWYIRDQDGVFLRGFEYWQQVEGRLIRYLWTAPLWWLGLVALDEEEASFGLSDQGAQLLGLQAPPQPPPPAPALLVGEDFRIVLPSGASLHDRFRVARFSSWQASWPGFTYRITQRDLRRAAKAGIKTAQILEFLHQASAEKVPANVRRALSKFQEG